MAALSAFPCGSWCAIAGPTAAVPLVGVGQEETPHRVVRGLGWCALSGAGRDHAAIHEVNSLGLWKLHLSKAAVRSGWEGVCDQRVDIGAPGAAGLDSFEEVRHYAHGAKDTFALPLIWTFRIEHWDEVLKHS